MGGHPGLLAVLVILLVSGALAEDDHKAENKTDPAAKALLELKLCIKNNPEAEPLIVNRPYMSAPLGVGFDLLNTMAMTSPLALTYKECVQTPDGKHFMPDQAKAITKNSKETFHNVQSFESVKEYFIHLYKSYSHGSALSGPRPSFPAVFSPNNEGVTNLVKNSLGPRTGFKRVIARLEDGVTKFEIGLKPTPKLSEDFRSKVKKLGAAVVLDKPKVADYLSDMLVKQYGTHVVDSVTVGGLSVHVLTKQISTTEDTKSQMSAFENTVEEWSSVLEKNKKEGNQRETSNDAKIKFSSLNNIMEAVLGGTKNESTLVSDWIKSVDDNLAVIWQGGRPIFELITKAQFPGYKHSTLWKISEKIAVAIGRYYKENTIAGCMDMDEPSFNFRASVGNKSLCELYFPFFGGFFGVLKLENPDDPDSNPPPQIEVKNQVTEELSCPEGYWPSGVLKDDTTSVGHAQINTTLKFCVGLEENNKLYYGGYGEGLLKICPLQFEAHALKPAMPDLKLCLSSSPSPFKDDRQEFGGMYTCNRGNPMARVLKKQNTPDWFQLIKKEFEKNMADVSGHPKACPPTFKGETVLNKMTAWTFKGKTSTGTKDSIFETPWSFDKTLTATKDSKLEVTKDSILESFKEECRVVLCSKGPWKIRLPPFSLINAADLNFDSPEYDDDGEWYQEGLAIFAFIALGVLVVLAIVVVIVIVLKKRKKQQAKGTEGNDTPSKKPAEETEDAVAEPNLQKTPVGTVMSLMFSTSRPDQETMSSSTKISSRTGATKTVG